MSSFLEADGPDLSVFKQPLPINRIAGLIERYRIDRTTMDRKYPILLSQKGRERRRRFTQAWLASLESNDIDFESLNHEERLDHVMLQNHLRFVLRQLEKEDTFALEIAPLLPFLPAILGLADARLALDWVEPSVAATELDRILTAVQSSESELKSLDGLVGGTRPKRTVANRAVEALASLRKMLKSWFEFYFGFDPMFTWWAEAPYRALDSSLEQYAETIKSLLVQMGESEANSAINGIDIIGDPIGRDALIDALKFEMIPYSPEELIRIAEKELAWCEAELREASEELGFGADTDAALEHVKTLHVPPGGQPEMVKKLALEAIDYLETNDLLTMPPLMKEAWRLEMMSPERQLVNPFFLGGEMIQVSYPTHTMSHERKQMSMRGNNQHFSRATVQHELIPGHHVQFFMMERYRPYRAPFQTPFWIEGWTIYWEFLLYSRCFPGSPENRIGMLFWRMHRCVRIIFSLSFHLERMSPTECIEMLVKRVGHERANAVAEVRRSCGDAYPPLYQCAYLIGGLQMWALRRELIDSGKMTDRAFHDAVIQRNCIPIEMLRADLTGRQLPKEFASSWRFYGDV